ncbi:uncharacterized protein LOC130014862 [Mercurialis annua]|uniref:uncharacterized protein LOC130014861 n=1 Tax=Mercurialis annua TaxID=3986 RepID=UPI0024AD388A|nr:uncharacterized protein LOC130014861 [Mercurialis annua]XP_055959799.1 uncharacterized protein LOC130014862 [Mercurialis annua]
MAIRPEETLSSPFFLHPNENPSLILASNLLNGGNYHSWSCTPTIADSISCLDSAFEIWTDLKDRFSQGDAYRIGDIQEEIYAFHQNTLSVTEYFTHLKSLWDELISLRPFPVCICIPKCICNALPLIRKNHSNDQVIRFLKGLNDQYATVRQQILMTEPLPPINKAFSMVIQNERQIAGSINMRTMVDTNVMFTKGENDDYGDSFDPNYEANVCYARGRGYFRGNNNNFKKFVPVPSYKQKLCSHCGMTGHTVDICYKKHGYPPGYQSSFQSRMKADGSYANQVDFEGFAPNPSDNNTDRTASYTSPGTVFPFTAEQCQKLMALIQQEASSSTPQNSFAHANALSANFQPNSETTEGISHCLFSSTSYKNKWILDTGATDHIVCDSILLKTFHAVKNVHVKLPNGQLVPVANVGTIHLSDKLILENVLHVPDFSFNLISASKLTDNPQISLILHHDSCFIQELTS